MPADRHLARLILDAMASSRRPRSVLQWLSNPRGGARVLRDLFGRGVVVSHEKLDELDNQEVWSLRRTLVDLGVLPDRVENLARLEVWLRTLDAALPAPRRHLVVTYGTWWVLRRAHRQHRRTGRFSLGSRRAAERRITAAADLLTWVDEQGLTLERLTQGDLDRWIETPHHGSHISGDAADFLRWAHRRRLTGQPRGQSAGQLAERLTVTRQPNHELDIVLSEDERWELLSRCLHNPDLPVDLRAAGALVLLYGISLTKIVELTKTHLCTPDPPDHASTATGLRVTLSSPVIIVPPALGCVLGQLPAQDLNPRSVPLIDPAPHDHRPPSPNWLFPGRAAAGHINASVLGVRLRQHGIEVRPSRNAALIALASDLPMSILSDLFDIIITAAVQWSRRAGRDWHAYIETVAATLHNDYDRN